MLDITPLTGTFGARIDGIDVSRGPSAVDEIARGGRAWCAVDRAPPPRPGAAR